MKQPVNMAQLNAKLRAMMAHPDGMKIFLSKITSPLKTRRDLQSGLRKVLQYDNLTQGDVPVYDLDPKAYAYMVPYQGSNPIRVQADESAQVTIRTFDMNAYKEFPLSLIQIARYDYLKRIEQQMKNAIIELEDTELLKCLEAVTADVSYPLTAVSGAVTPENVQNVYSQVEMFNDPTFLVGNSIALGKMRTWGVDIFSPVRREQILKTGVVGYVWGAAAYKTRLAPNNRVFITAEPEMVGRIPERMGLTPLKADSPRDGKMQLGFLQHLGISVFNGKAVGVLRVP